MIQRLLDIKTTDLPRNMSSQIIRKSIDTFFLWQLKLIQTVKLSIVNIHQFAHLLPSFKISKMSNFKTSSSNMNLHVLASFICMQPTLP